jgi:nitrous oxidase accessory protein
MTVTGNTFTENSVGCYLMYALRLTMTDNLMLDNRGPSGYGLALKDMDEVVADGNIFANNRTGLYIDNSPALYEGYNYFTGNLFAYNDIAITTLPAVERNIFQANVFLDNVQQVSTDGRGDLQGNLWDTEGIGNYWSDYAGFDQNNDGIGDTPYRAERLSESLADANPILRLFIYSPALQALDFAGAAFPTLRPEPKLIDTAPLMQHELLDGNTNQPLSLPLLSLALVLCGIATGIYWLTFRAVSEWESIA